MSVPALLTYSDFQNHPLYIQTQKFDDGNTKLSDIVLKVQKDIFTKLLGEVLYYDFDNDYSGGEFQSQKWIDFVDGKLYQVDGRNVNWLGAKNMLKYFAYYFYMKYNYYQLTTIGKIMPGMENSEKVPDFTNEIEMYNEGVKLYGVDWQCKFNWYSRLRSNIPDTIPELRPTAYNFLSTNESDYENWEFKEIHEVNEFNI